MADETTPKGNQKGRLQIQLDDAVAQGQYANMSLVNHTETEFVLDFVFIQPLEPRAKVRSRIISSPKHAKRFLEKGCKVQVNVFFRGRERAHTEIAKHHLERMAEELEELAKVEVPPKMEGYRMIMVLAPTPKALKISRDRKAQASKAKAGGDGQSKKSRRAAKQKAKDSGRLEEASSDELEDSAEELEAASSEE